ncbi:MAG TPA: HAD-IC family P-type ATPase [Polyangiaceae bacterium]|nr:HAD-IC family P-type ATPase [Polyangiaceae bacterium]
MTEAVSAERPRGKDVPCATCGTRVDPLRAARVAIFDDRFRYFCSGGCRESYDANAGRTPLPLPRRAANRSVDRDSAIPEEEAARWAARRAAVALSEVEGDGLSDIGSALAGLSAPAPEEEAAAPVGPLDVPPPTDVGTLLVAIALVAGLLAAALALVGPSPIALTVRVVLVLVAAGAFVAHAVTTAGDSSELHPALACVAPIGAAAVALAARIAGDPLTSDAASFGGILVGSVAVIVWLVDRARHPLDVERALVKEGLTVPGHRIVGEDVARASADDLRPGEEIIVEANEVVPADATIVAGSATVHPWLSATSTITREEGDSVVAGARVVSGRVRAVAGWAGADRAFMRLTHDPRRRADVHAPLASFGRNAAARGSIVGAVVAALFAFSSDRELVTIGMYACATIAVLANRGLSQIAALHVMETVLHALRRGVVFRTAEALDRAGRVGIAAFCARGTLLLGEPEVASIEAFAGSDPETVLSLVAGTEAGSSRPTSVAVQRAARARGVRPDGVRSPTVQPGLGVTAVASSGQTLVVGSRGLMLRERISVALAESKIGELEAMGRTVLLVAIGGKLIGLVGLQDGLRPGARAAVQHLLDVGIEPVLLSGDTRETCEALGRAVDIDHIRPEVLPADRGDEIRRLADGGAVVAVLGRSPNDDVALSAGDVSVALSSAGGASSEWSVQLCSDDVRDAAFALRLAHDGRRRAALGLAWCLAPGLVAALLMAVGIVPAWATVVTALAATAIALGRFPTG